MSDEPKFFCKKKVLIPKTIRSRSAFHYLQTKKLTKVKILFACSLAIKQVYTIMFIFILKTYNEAKVKYIDKRKHTRTHTHTHTYREKERERGKERERKYSI